MNKRAGWAEIAFAFWVLFLLSSPGFSQDIFDASSKGELDKIKTLLGQNPKWIDASNDDGDTPLLRASGAGHIQVVEYLVSAGADINHLNNYGFNSLQYAILGKHTETAKLLINKGAELNRKNRWGHTALYSAVNANLPDIIELLISQGADMTLGSEKGEVPAALAVRNGNRKLLDLLINKGMDLELKDNGGNTLLLIASLKNNKDIMEYLISRGAIIDANNLTGKTALHLSVIKGYRETAAFLLEKGADINAKDITGNTPLFYAIKYGHNNLADLLTGKGADKTGTGELSDASSILKSTLKEKEAYVWYMGHSGFAIKTRNHLMIFDFWGYDPLPDNPSLANGNLNPEEFKNQNVKVFVTHGHRDHFDPKVMELEKSHANIKYLFGWKAKEEDKYAYFTQNREFQEIDGIKITSLITPDPGSAFLVETDGLKFVFFGDFYGDYKENIDRLAKEHKNLDFYFYCSVGGPMEIAHYMLEYLPAKVIFPMHSGGTEFMLKLFVNEFKDKYSNINFAVPENRGDLFFYKNGNIR